MTQFFTSRMCQPPRGEVEASYSFRTRFFKDPNAGRDYMKQMAINAGFNAILNFGFEKNTFSTGNYQYTVHAFSGDFALVTELAPADDKQDALDANEALQSHIAYVDECFERVKHAEEAVRLHQLGPSTTDGIFSLIMIAIFLAGLVYLFA